MTFEVDLKGLCDANGFLTHQGSWNKDIACRLARAEGIELLDAHWEVISLLQAFYKRFGDSPANRALVSYVKEHLGSDKGSSLYLMTLFPGSPARVGSRIAGLPKPKNCL
ncbi:TusE/DsrC/DsvC family sulfur relay protein [Luminiphilus sp.]|nr:TusE/DsrC/DsvC family sulfur relay protein [Luminiphilus sp.]